ncbi:MAG: hypothetical protein ACRDKT_12210 [Actinomycetota bacterium]
MARLIEAALTDVGGVLQMPDHDRVERALAAAERRGFVRSDAVQTPPDRAAFAKLLDLF